MKELIEPLQWIGEISTISPPHKLFRKFLNSRYSFFLESGGSVGDFSRYSFIGSEPFLVFKSKGKQIEICEGDQSERFSGDPFDVLKMLISQYSLASSGHSPFPGGAVGYFGYDLCHFVEKLPRNSFDDLQLPDCYLGFYDRVVTFDHLTGRLFISSSGLPEKEPARRRERAKWRLEETLDILNRDSREDLSVSEEHNIAEISSNFSRPDYLDAVERAKEYIRAGDIFQVNLSQRFVCSRMTLPFIIYEKLRRINPAPFASFLNFPELSIVGASPERFLRISGRRVQTRPIKGTRPRGGDSLEDSQLARELLESEKDKAELIMIVDLERNDLGRVCEYGSVRVPKLITLETYPTVFHLVSTVEGVLKEDKDHIDCLRACFPGGSITGAPKIRAMEIIDELEPNQRGVYTGSIGYIGFNWETDLNIVIRTMVMTGGKIYFHAGGGIVADSDPATEYEETLHKAKALIKTLTIEKEREALIHPGSL
ncbi:MAG: aminodeoxychorismate synthase component I [bacterium]